MRILVTNDDGIYGPGLKVLEKIAASISKDVWVVVPEGEQSGSSHSLTLTAPLRIRKRGARRYSISGTPTDSVMLGVHSIIKGGRPDLVLSGVNRGGNLGEDVTYSGTVACAMEGTLLGIPSIALSQVYKHGHPVKWATAAHHGPKVVRKLLKAGWPKGTLVNVNFPDVVADAVTGVFACQQGQRDLTDLLIEARMDMRNNPYYWIGFRREQGKPKATSDLGVIASGGISVTPLHLDLTHTSSMKALAKALQ
jgi:5'-nucleotidase